MDPVLLSSDSPDESIARQLLKEKLAHYEATGSRNLEEAGWRLKHLDHFRGMRASRITGPAINEYIIQRQRAGAANGTINREVAVLLRMLRLGFEHQKLVRLPIVHKPKEAAPRAGFFEADAFAAVRGQLPEDLQVAVTVAYTFGWRMQSEVLALETRQLDLAGGTIRLDPGRTKNDEGRVVYLTPELRELLTAHVERVQALSRDLKRVVPWFVPPLRQTAPREPTPGLPEGLEDGLRGRRLCRDAPPRLPPDGGSEHGQPEYLRAGGDDHHRP